MAKKEERFEVTFRDGSQLKDEGVRQILPMENPDCKWERHQSTE